MLVCKVFRLQALAAQGKPHESQPLFTVIRSLNDTEEIVHSKRSKQYIHRINLLPLFRLQFSKALKYALNLLIVVNYLRPSCNIDSLPLQIHYSSSPHCTRNKTFSWASFSVFSGFCSFMPSMRTVAARQRQKESITCTFQQSPSVLLLNFWFSVL